MEVLIVSTSFPVRCAGYVALTCRRVGTVSDFRMDESGVGVGEETGRPARKTGCGWNRTSAVRLFLSEKGGGDAIQEIADPLTADGVPTVGRSAR